MPPDDTLYRRIRESLIGALALAAFDVATGSFLISLFVVPIWFLGSLIKSGIQPPPGKTGLIRALIPLATLTIVLANSTLQSRIAKSNAERIVLACEQFHTNNGHYPSELGELVPKYLPHVPRAKYCLIWGEFWYFNNSGDPLMYWVDLPPFGRPTYRFEARRWGYLD